MHKKAHKAIDAGANFAAWAVAVASTAVGGCGIWLHIIMIIMDL